MKRFLMTAVALLSLLAALATPADSNFGVGPQYDTTHVYVQPENFDKFVASLVATFGGTTTKQGVFTVTPTPSQTMSQLKTPVPYPFGAERTGYLVTNLDAAVRAAQADGADVLVSPFDDPIGRDAVIQWPGGVSMQLYWHTTAPSYPALQTVPENRVYVSAERAPSFVKSFLGFSHGKVTSDDAHAPGIEIGRASDTYRRIRISSVFGGMAVLVTDGHLPYPYGHEMTGYEVGNLASTLDKARAAGVSILAGPFSADGRNSAMVQFPGGYIAEIHSKGSER